MERESGALPKVALYRYMFMRDICIILVNEETGKPDSGILT